jgi:hypothetical protein
MSAQAGSLACPVDYDPVAGIVWIPRHVSNVYTIDLNVGAK